MSPNVHVYQEPVNVDFILKYGLCRYNQVTSRTYWIMMAPKSNDWYPFNKREILTQRQMHRENAMWQWRQRLSDTSTSQGTSKIAGNHQTLAIVKEAFFLKALMIPRFWISSLHNSERINFGCFKPPSICGTLLWQH